MDLYMTIGISGSGKSTWANNNKGILFDEIYSSDEYRKNLLNDEENQSQNSYIFATMYKDAVAALESGNSICIDATNLTKRGRRIFLKKVESIPNLNKIAVVFIIDLDTAKKRNTLRERVVPEYVIDRQYEKLNSNKDLINLLEYDFDEIRTIDNNR